MTKVEAVVIRDRVETVIDAVEQQTGHVGVTVVEAIGHGRQRGDDRPGPERHQRARHAEQRTTSDRGVQGDVARRQDDRAWHRLATLEVEDRQRAVG